jgi:hypothetical protein
MSTGDAAVECYSGYTYAQEPRAVIWEGHRYPVERIEGRWRTPGGPGFRVATDQGLSFDIQYSEDEDRWTVQPRPASSSY